MAADPLGVLARLALTVLLLVFWAGYLDFPLSDFPALTMALLALVAIDRSEQPLWMLTAGLASAASIEMRPSYLLLAPMLAVLVVWRWWEQRGEQHATLARRASCVGLLLAGFVLIALPQSLASHRHFHTWSFVPGAASHLTSLQFTEGLRLQRYETYVGSGHPPRMLYDDPSGTRLLEKQTGQTIKGTSQYLGLVVSHPVTMAGVFMRHLINGLDQRYDTPYVAHLDTGSQRWLRFAGFLLIFLALVRVLWGAARRRLGPARWRYIVVFALCCATSIPSAVEPRYLLPAYLLSYLLVLLPGWPNPLGERSAGIRRYRTFALLGLGFVVFMAVAAYVTSHASSQLHFGAV